jgi:sigma-70-like protein
LSPVEPVAPVTADSGEHSELGVDVGHCARLLALIATLSSPDREIVLLRMVAGVSIPDIVAALGVTPGVVCRVQRQALSALQPAAIAHGRLPAARQRVVLLPHARTELADIRPDNRRIGGVNGMNHDDFPRQYRTQSNGVTGAIAASTQWHDAELAMKVARHSFDRWLTSHGDTSPFAVMHAYHTHTALHEAARAITMLIETFCVEAAALITTPAQGTDVPTQRR